MRREITRLPEKHFEQSEFEVRIKRITSLRDGYNKTVDKHNLLLELFNKIKILEQPLDLSTVHEMFSDSILSNADWTVVILKGLVERMEDLKEELQKISEAIDER